MAHRYRLTPESAQRQRLARHCADARYVWNLALEQANYWRPDRGSTPGSAERLRQLAEARRGSWLGQGSSSVQQQALRDFDRALRNWWGGSHRRRRWRKARLDEGFCVRDVTVGRLNRKWAALSVPKLGPVRFRLSRPLPEAFGMARVTMDRAGRWHVSFTAPQPVLERTTTGRAIGLDAGVVATLTGSDGQRRQAPGLGADEARRLRRLQRKLARQHKGSNRRARTKSSLARLRVAKKRGLNRAISAQSWSEFRRRLEDKAATCDVTVVAVDPAFTSQRCSVCGHTEEMNRQSQAVFLCRACGHHDNADVNAATNILAAGLAVTARGGTPRQGPDETRTRPVAA